MKMTIDVVKAGSRFIPAMLPQSGVYSSAHHSTIVHSELVSKVNDSLPKERQFAELVWYLPKTLRLHSEYRMLFPGEELLLKWRIAVAIGLVSLVICAWSLGFFSH
jgi:hypothetical protein